MMSSILPKNERRDNYVYWKLSQRSFFGSIENTIIYLIWWKHILPLNPSQSGCVVVVGGVGGLLAPLVTPALLTKGPSINIKLCRLKIIDSWLLCRTKQSWRFFTPAYWDDVVYGRPENWNVKNDFVSSARQFGVIWWPYFRVQNRRYQFHFLPHVLHYLSRCLIFPSEKKIYMRTKVRHKLKECFS